MKKTLVYIIFFTISYQICSQNTIVTKTITPANWSNYPVVNSNHIKGGIHSISNITDTATIPKERRVNGMLCYVTSTNQTYQLYNNKWVKIILIKQLQSKIGVTDTAEIFYNKVTKLYEYFDGTNWQSFSQGSQSSPFADPSTVDTYSDNNYVYTCVGIDNNWYAEKMHKTTYIVTKSIGSGTKPKTLSIIQSLTYN